MTRSTPAAGLSGLLVAEPEAGGGHWIRIGDLRLVGAMRSPSEAVAVPLLTCFRCHPSSDQLTAYAWVVELAEASWHLLYEFPEGYELGYFAQPSDDLDARDGQP